MKRKSVRRKQQLSRDSLSRHLLKTVLGAFILLAVVIGAGLTVVYLFNLEIPKQSRFPGATPEAAPSQKGPVFEIYPSSSLPPSPHTGRPLRPGQKPRVAIIIDDLGYDMRIARDFLACDIPITFSILPHSPFSEKVAYAAHNNGIDVMLHLPMEPKEYPSVSPGPGVLLTAMSPDELLRQLEINMAAVPYVKGVNNHMGSRLTTVSTQLYQIFSILKKHDCFFVDSRTTGGSLCRPSARLLQVPFAERDVFLDNTLTPAYIGHQLDLLVDVARRKGQAIGIGHPHAVTYQVLAKKIPDMSQSVEFVPVAQLVHVIR